jgi:Zn-dependent M28 family amino/carboxypeptidase
MTGACLWLLVSCAGASENGPAVPITPSIVTAQNSSAEINLRFNGSNALNFVYEQLAMGPRTSFDAKQIPLRDKLSAKLKALGFEVIIQPLKGSGGKGDGVNFYNVIAALKSPLNPKFKVFGAHYDTIPIAPNDADPAMRAVPIPGANDGASGVAVLLELARVISERKNELKHSIKLIFFDGEDFSTGIENMLYGSKHYAANMSADEIKSIEYFILIDMIGDKDLNIYQDINSVNAYPALTAHIFETANKLGLKGFIARPKYQIIDDHIPFINAGVPSAVLIDFDFPYWHTLSDTADKVSADSLSQTGRLLEYLIFEN